MSHAEEKEAIEATWRQHINMLQHREGKRPEKIQVGYGLLSRYRIVAGIKPTQKVVLDGVEVWG